MVRRPASIAAESSATKVARGAGALSLALEPTADILAGTRDARRAGAVIVGFALETGDAVARGREKLTRKGLDLVVVNDALEPGAGFETETNRVVIIDRDGGSRDVPLQDKLGVANAILDAVEQRLG